MRLKDRLRQAEQQGKQSAHRAAEIAREGLHTLETSLRRTLNHGAPAPMSSHPDAEGPRLPEPKVRTGIVSVNGQDVGEIRCTGGRRSA